MSSFDEGGKTGGPGEKKNCVTIKHRVTKGHVKQIWLGFRKMKN